MRDKRKRRTWKAVEKLLIVLTGLDRGTPSRQPSPGGRGSLHYQRNMNQ